MSLILITSLRTARKAPAPQITTFEKKNIAPENKKIDVAMSNVDF